MSAGEKGPIGVVLRGRRLLLHPDNTVTDADPFEQVGREPVKLSDAIAASVRKAAEEGTDLARTLSISPRNGGVSSPSGIGAKPPFTVGQLDVAWAVYRDWLTNCGSRFSFEAWLHFKYEEARKNDARA